MTKLGSFLFTLGLSAAPQPPKRNIERVAQQVGDPFRCMDCGIPFNNYMAYNDHVCDRMFADWTLTDGGFDRAA